MYALVAKNLNINYTGWNNLTAIYNGKAMILFLNSKEVARRENVSGNIDAYDSPVIIGQNQHLLNKNGYYYPIKIKSFLIADNTSEAFISLKKKKKSALETNFMNFPLSHIVKVPDQIIKQKGQKRISLPPLPVRSGKVAVLLFKAFSRKKNLGGCNWNMQLKINGITMGARTSKQTERFINRSSLKLKNHNTIFSLVKDDKIMTMFAPNARVADTIVEDKSGASFLVDISDVIQGVDGNNLLIINTCQTSPELVIQEIEFGYLEEKYLNQFCFKIPIRGDINLSKSIKGVKLSQAEEGGFSVSISKELEILVETTVSMNKLTPSELIAEDTSNRKMEAKIKLNKEIRNGFKMTATWPDLQLERTLQIKDNLVHWREKWTNLSNKTKGIPFRHRLFIRKKGNFDIYLGGSKNETYLPTSTINPTVYLGARDLQEKGFGITAENDYMTLLMSLARLGDKKNAGVEIFSQNLALRPGNSIELTLAIEPVASRGGYCDFINNTRERWKLNSFTMDRPVFFEFKKIDIKNPVEQIKKSLNHLGPVYVVIGPWSRLVPDQKTVLRNKYPKLKKEAEKAPGKCPDFDAQAWNTFKHRNKYREQFRKNVDFIHKYCPDVKVLQMHHPAMEIVYKPTMDLLPYAKNVILTKSGKSFSHSWYTDMYLKKWTLKDWGLYYFLPKMDSPYLASLEKASAYSMDVDGADGVYWDEFAWATRTGRGYNRYDYRQYDGFSADLNEKGDVIKLKSDTGYLSKASQSVLIDMALKRNKFFLCNGGLALREIRSLPVASFTEACGGKTFIVGSHLSNIPLIYNNPPSHYKAVKENNHSQELLFEQTKTYLGLGAICSPRISDNLFLKGPDNFICKMYPITIKTIGPGFILARERLITMNSGEFDWPDKAAVLRIYKYNAKGDIEKPVKIRKVNGKNKIKITVPDGGLVIAEIIS